jgi:signal transduction histidine kinase
VDAKTRHDVYRQVLAENGIEYDPELVEFGPFTSEFGAQAVQKLLERPTAPDAIVASNDGMALGALQVLRTRGFRIPRDVALTGFDDLALARHVHPPLTTVRQPLERMGEAAIENLLRQMAGEGVPARLDLPVQLVRRSSCGCDAELPRRTSIETADSAQDPLGWLDRNAERLIESLASTLALPRERGMACVSALIHGVRAELDGDEGALVVALDDVAATAGDRIDVFEELHVIVGALRVEFGKNPELEDTWHAARRSIAAAHSAEQSRRRMAVEASYWRLLASGERLSTAFDWPSLKAALADELPDMVENAFVSLYTDADERELRPFFCMRDGRVFDTGNARFPASELVPPGVLEDARCGTWFVLPLTYENDNLGIAVFDPGTGIGAHEMLRKQIGAALKSVALHREIVQKTTLHERSVQERLATAKRMSSLSVLAGGVAHDLNNALGPLVVLPDVILQELDEVRAGRDDAELRSDISTIKTAALRAAQTIKDLLALGRQGRTSREALDLTQVVRSCVATEQRTQPEGVSLELHVYPEPLVVQASDAQVARAVTNLIRNAVESLGGGSGRVIVQTEAIRLVRPYAGT